MKKFYRSEKDKVFGGIIGGLGEFFDVDPVLLRLFCLAFFVFTGILPGLIFYFCALLVVPKKPKDAH